MRRLLMFTAGLLLALFAALAPPGLAATHAVATVITAGTATAIGVTVQLPLLAVIAIAGTAMLLTVAATASNDFRYNLSKLLPTPMRSTYTLDESLGSRRQTSTWFQWRGHILRHRSTPLLT